MISHMIFNVNPMLTVGAKLFDNFIGNYLYDDLEKTDIAFNKQSKLKEP